MVSDEQSGKRLDVFLTENWENAKSRSNAQRAIKAGEVLVNGKNVSRVSVKVSEGQTVQVSENDDPEPPAIVSSNIPLDVIYEDDDNLEVLMECFSARIAETPEGDDRPIWSNGGTWPIKDYAKWLEQAKKKRMEVKASKPLGKVWLVPREVYVSHWRTNLIPKSGDDLLPHRGKSRLILGKFTRTNDRLFVGAARQQAVRAGGRDSDCLAPPWHIQRRESGQPPA